MESNSNAAIANTTSAVAEDERNNNSNTVYNAFPSTTVSGHDDNANSNAFELGFQKKHVVGTGRDHLANERTYLAWFRTALALMGASIGLIKFGADSGLELEGYLLGLVGLVAIMTSTRRYFYVMRQINADEAFVPNVIGISITVVIAAAAYGIAFSTYYVTAGGDYVSLAVFFMVVFVVVGIGYSIYLAKQHHHHYIRTE